LKGARLGVIREGLTNPKKDSEDYKNVEEVFEKALQEMKSAGAELVDPVVIPNMRELLSTRVRGPEEDESFAYYFTKHPNAPYKSRREIGASPEFAKVYPQTQERLKGTFDPPWQEYYKYLLARQELLSNVLKVMADNKLDALIYKTMEGTPPRIKKGPAPNSEPGSSPPGLNTFLVLVPTIAFPVGWTKDNLPVGITMQGRPYEDGLMIKLAYAYEQATHHRKPPQTTPPLQ
jgi:amidase